MRPLARLVLPIVASLALAGCSAPGTPVTPSASAPAGTGSATATASAADVMFTQMMIPHHEQAIVMSDLILAKPGVSAEVTALATAIKGAQQPEIDRMRGWLKTWGEAEGGEHGGHAGMGGMLTQQQLDAIRDASGVEAEKLFLTGMIGHHEGAIVMAKEVQGTGSHPEVRALAQAIITSQQAEIETMRTLAAARG